MDGVGTDHRHAAQSSRRSFLIRTGAAALSPLALARCSSKKEHAHPVAEVPLQTEQQPVVIESTHRPAIPNAEPIIRVRIERIRPGQNRSPESVVITAAEDHKLSLLVESATSEILTAPLRVYRDVDAWRIVDHAGLQHLHEGTSLTIRPAPSSTTMIVAGRTYQGSIVLHGRTSPAGAGAFDVVNHVPLEAYLPGVLAMELYRHWHLQAFCAQAIAARSFAVCEIAQFAKTRHFDVTNTQRSQVFGGMVQHEHSQRAVKDTHGLMLTYQDRMVPGYYSSCCGGMAARAVDAIGPNPINDITPLHGRSGNDWCADTVAFRWAVKRSASDVATRLRSYGRRNKIESLTALNEPQSIEATAFNVHGRPTQYSIRPKEGLPAEIGAERLRYGLNSRASREGLGTPKKRLPSSNMLTEVDSNTFQFDGRGWGHGVGLCQYGAQVQAQAGIEHVNILRAYYPEVELAQAYASTMRG